MKLRTIVTLLVLLVPVLAQAQSDGGTQSPFSLGVGSRELSMGGANMALSDPTTAPFWNSARLAGAERLAFAAFHSQLFESGISYDYAGLVYPTLDHGTLGIGVFRHGVGGIDKRDASNVSLGDIKLNQFRMYFAYGRVLSDFHLGLSVTLEHHSLDTYTSTSSPGLDIAVSRSFELPSMTFPRVTLALNGIHLIQPGIRLADETYSYPRGLSIGGALDIRPGAQAVHRMLLSASFEKADDVAGQLRVGLEYAAMNRFFLRGGLQDQSPTVGAGIRYQGFDFDYALLDRNLGTLHMFTLSVSIGEPVGVRRARRSAEREQHFNEAMENRLLDQNRALLSELLAEGKQQLAAGAMAEGLNSLDAALMLARSTGSDTTQIVALIDQAQIDYEQMLRAARFVHNLDSATVRLRQEDYLAARRFAEQALQDEPESDTASVLLASAEQALSRLAESQQLITAEIARIDTLLAEDRLTEAEAVIQSLLGYAPDDNAVELAAMRVEMARWRQTLVVTPTAESDAGSPQDSALTAQVTVDSSTSAQATRVATTSPGPDTLSADLRREVENSYRAAQVAFQAGDLEQAIDKWERVERLAPDFLSVREYLVRAYKFVGVSLYAQKRRVEAVETWKKAARLDPADEEIQDYIKHTEVEISKLGKLSYDER